MAPGFCATNWRKRILASVLHVQNGGAAYARQKRVELATGEWVVFVDSDDTMPADALQRLFQATSEDTDIVVGFAGKSACGG